MTTQVWRRLHARMGGDRGFTLVELLVSMVIFGILASLVLGFTIASGKRAQASNQYNEINEEARVVLNRMSRELREAQTIVAATNPGGSTFTTNADSSVTFDVDFDGNGTIDPNAADPEEITYYYDRAKQQLLLKAAGQSVPVLAANVTAFKISYNSRIYRLGVYNLDGDIAGSTPDGIVSWEELDKDPSGIYGNGNGQLDVELKYIDSVTIDLTMLKGIHTQQYTVTVDLHNRPY